MGLFRKKSKRRSNSDASTSQPPLPSPAPYHQYPQPPNYGYNPYGAGPYNGGGYNPYGYSYQQPPYHRNPPQGERIPPLVEYGYPYGVDRSHFYPPTPRWTPQPVDPTPLQRATYLNQQPGCSKDRDPIDECFIL